MEEHGGPFVGHDLDVFHYLTDVLLLENPALTKAVSKDQVLPRHCWQSLGVEVVSHYVKGLELFNDEVLLGYRLNSIKFIAVRAFNV